MLFHLLRVEKHAKGDSITFRLKTSMKGKALDDLFKFKESDKIKMTAQEC